MRTSVRTTRTLAAGLTALALAGLAACSGDASTSGTDPLEVEVGEEFTWNDFTVQEGWQVSPVERSVGIEESVVSPEITGSIVNNLDEERAPVFQVVFLDGDETLAAVNCSSQKLVQDQSGALLCPGFGATMPQDYDSVVVRELVRDDGRGGDEGGDA